MQSASVLQDATIIQLIDQSRVTAHLRDLYDLGPDSEALLLQEAGRASKSDEREPDDYHLQLVQRWRSMLRIDEWFENLGSSVETTAQT